MPLNIPITIGGDDFKCANGSEVTCVSDKDIPKRSFVSAISTIDIQYPSIFSTDAPIKRMLKISDTEILICNSSELRYINLSNTSRNMTLISESYGWISDIECIGNYLFILYATGTIFRVTKYKINISSSTVTVSKGLSTVTTIHDTAYSCSGGTIRKLKSNNMLIVLHEVDEVCVIDMSLTILGRTYAYNIVNKYMSQAYELYSTGENEYVLDVLESNGSYSRHCVLFTIDPSTYVFNKITSTCVCEGTYSEYSNVVHFHDRVFATIQPSMDSDREAWLVITGLVFKQTGNSYKDYDHRIEVHNITENGYTPVGLPYLVSDNLVSIYTGVTGDYYKNKLHKINVSLNSYYDTTGTVNLTLTMNTEYDIAAPRNMKLNPYLIHQFDSDLYIIYIYTGTMSTRACKISTTLNVLDSTTTANSCVGITVDALKANIPGKMIAINGGY